MSLFLLWNQDYEASAQAITKRYSIGTDLAHTIATASLDFLPRVPGAWTELQPGAEINPFERYLIRAGDAVDPALRFRGRRAQRTFLILVSAGGLFAGCVAEPG